MQRTITFLKENLESKYGQYIKLIFVKSTIFGDYFQKIGSFGKLLELIATGYTGQLFLCLYNLAEKTMLALFF